MQRWRQITNAVLSVAMVLGMTVLPQLSKPANAQSPGDTRTLQEEVGTRTEKLPERNSVYDARTGYTTVQQKQQKLRVFKERIEKYQQTGTTIQTRYRTVTRTRKQTVQVLKTGTREVTTYQTSYRPVYKTVANQVAKTGYRTENQLRYQAYEAQGYHWVEHGSYAWAWKRHTGYRWVNRWYTSPGYWRGYWRRIWSWRACGWVSYYDCVWVAGYRYSECVLESYSYYSCDLQWRSYWAWEGYTYTAWHWVSVPITVAYTYYETQYVQEPVYDTTYVSSYQWSWFPNAERRPIWGTVWISRSGWYDYAPYGRRWYNWCDCPYVIKGYEYFGGWKYGLVTKAVQVARQEPYQVPVTTTETYTYYEPKTITVAYAEQAPFSVVVPAYGWVVSNDWTTKEQVTDSSWVTLGKINLGLGASLVADAASGKAATFLSDRGSGNSKEVLIGSRKRILFKADRAIVSIAKKQNEAASTITLKGKGDVKQVAQATLSTPAAQAIPAVAPATAFSLSDWTGNWLGPDNRLPFSFTQDGSSANYQFVVVYNNQTYTIKVKGAQFSSDYSTFTNGKGDSIKLTRKDSGEIDFAGTITELASKGFGTDVEGYKPGNDGNQNQQGGNN